jgi:hypothetical protein
LSFTYPFIFIRRKMPNGLEAILSRATWGLIP